MVRMRRGIAFFLEQYDYFFLQQYNWIDSFFRSLLPFILISTGNIVTVTLIVIANRHRKDHMQGIGNKENNVKDSKVRAYSCWKLPRKNACFNCNDTFQVAAFNFVTFVAIVWIPFF
jgi:hypothetical protein